MKRLYTSKRHLCPVCGNHHGCAIRSDNLIECLRSSSQHDAPAGYRFIKPLRNDMGGLFVADEKTSQNREERLYSHQKRAYSGQTRKGLSIEERDRQNRLLLNSRVSSLGTQHFSHLQEQRQLTTQEINWLKDLGWVRSWEPGLSAPVGVTSALAGISPEGKLLGREGIAIAALDPHFHITGFQIATLRTEPKYIWLSSANQGGAGPQLPNGELPLFCWKHPNTKKVKVVILCEGALKSLLTAMFLWRSGQADIAVIGTASAAYYGEQTLKNYLKLLRPQEIRLMPDASAILNPHIAQANESTLQQCRKLRYHLSVGDWGQLETKQQLDIDELLAASQQQQIKLISAAAYLNRSHIHHQIRQLLKQPAFDLLQDKLIALQPNADSPNNIDLIHQYAKGIEYCRKGGYQVVVNWHNEIITPEEFFAGCSEQVQKYLAAVDREWGMLYKIKLWVKRILERYRPKNGFGQQNSKTKADQKKLVSPETQDQSTLAGNIASCNVIQNSSPLAEKIAPCKVIEYKPGKFPKCEDLQQPPKIVFKKEQRLQVYTEAIASGWKHILDRSATGTFKSYDAGTAEPKILGVDKLWYFTNHARNVTTETIERNYEYLNVRNSGMVRDNTPSGKAYLRWPKQGETPDTAGNCHRSQIFNVLRSKNIDAIEDKENPICATCHLLEACRSRAGSGFGYRYMRRETFKNDRIRAHPNSAPSTDDFDWSHSGIFWDETMQTVQPVNTITAKLQDIDRVMAELMTNAPDISMQLQQVWVVLRECITGEIEQPYYGWNDAGVRGMLGKPPANLPEIITTVQNIVQPDLLPIISSSSKYNVNLNELPKKKPKPLTNNVSNLAEKIQTEVVVNWFIPFLQVWGRKIPGAMRLGNEQLTITTRNFHHSVIAQSAKWNVYLDATAKPEYIAWWFNIQPEEILTLEQETTKAKNLHIIQITGLGQVSKNRSSYCQEKVDVLRAELLSRHSDIKFIDFVKHCQREDGGWFRDSRGSNEFQRVTALATFGIPYQNIGYLESLYLTLRPIKDNHDLDDLGRNRELQHFINWITQAEIIQAIGRLRAYNRLEEKLYFYFCADYDLSFLECEIKYVKASDIAIEAGSKDEKSWWKIKNAVKELWSQGQKITQPVIAEFSGMSQGYISKLASEFGEGWKQWLKIFLSLLNSNNSQRNNFENEDNTLRKEAEEMLVDLITGFLELESNQELLTEVFELDKQYQHHILAQMPLKLQSKIIAALLSILPNSWCQELIELQS